MPDPEPFAPFIADRLWNNAPPPSSPWRRRLQSTLRMTFAVVRDVADGRLSLHAASLVYTTILSLVPLIALGFSVLKGFGIHYRFEPLLKSGLAPLGSQAQVIAERLMQFVDRMDVAVLGTVGVAVLFYTAISVVQKVETAFGEIWRVHTTRPLVRKFTDYLSVLLIGPVLMFSAIGVATSLIASESVRELETYLPLTLLIEAAGQLVPFLLVVVTFTFLYKFLPYTRVHTSSALVGGLVAGLIWVIAGWLFAAFVSSAGSYTAIYSAFASLIIFLIWLNVNWLILLIGASIAFYDQHPESMALSSYHVHLSNRSRERLALATMAAVGDAHYAGEPPPTTAALSQRLHVPEQPLERMLAALSQASLLAATKGEKSGWLPARPYETTALKLALDAARMIGDRTGFDRSHIVAGASETAVEARIEDAIAHATEGCRLKDLLTTQPDEAKPEIGDSSANPQPRAAPQAAEPPPRARTGTR